MSKTFRPLLAATYDPEQDLSWPRLASPKLDGQRVVIRDGQAVSRSLKPVANEALRATLSHPLLDGLDGEVLAGDPNSTTAFNATIRAVSTQKGSIDGLVFYVFDDSAHPNLPFFERLESARLKVEAAQSAGLPVEFLHHDHITSEADAMAAYERNLARGLEGLMLRDPRGLYKYGRSTLRSGELIKLKEFTTSEAVVVGVEPLYRNGNEAVINALGLQERSTHQGNKIADELMGALVVRDLGTWVEFKIGTGFTQLDREMLWATREALPGRIVTYKSASAGVVEAPRHPVFIGFRPIDDMSEAA